MTRGSNPRPPAHGANALTTRPPLQLICHYCIIGEWRQTNTTNFHCIYYMFYEYQQINFKAYHIITYTLFIYKVIVGTFGVASDFQIIGFSLIKKEKKYLRAQLASSLIGIPN